MAKTKIKSESRKKAAPPSTLNVAFVWDMSGSMASVYGATKEGTRGYLMDLQAEESKLAAEHGAGIYTRFSLTAFDTVFEEWITDTPIAKVSIDFTMDRYQPRGGTALYDAIANTIARLQTELQEAGRENEKCLVIVMTDGEENSSKEYSLQAGGRSRLFNLIKSYEAKGNWTFVYLGANVDAYAEGGAIGFAKGNTAYYAATPDSIAAASASLSNVTSSRRSGMTGQTVTAFADAGEGNDYRDQEIDPEIKKKFDSGSATSATRKIR